MFYNTSTNVKGNTGATVNKDYIISQLGTGGRHPSQPGSVFLQPQ